MAVRRFVTFLVVASLSTFAATADADDVTGSPSEETSASAGGSTADGGAPAADDDDAGFGVAPVAMATIRPHAYTLAECLALADRNFPNLWAARARLAFAHAQLEEARWTPWFQWSAGAQFGVVPPILGTVVYPQSSLESARDISGSTPLAPTFQFGINGTVPIYTFGKIDSSVDSAIANVRVSEWDMEKWRQALRMDVRRAYYGLQLARDAKEVLRDSGDRIDHAIRNISDKLKKGDTSVGEVDRLRLLGYREELNAQSMQAPKGEAYALAALRFMTGVVGGFDVPDEPLSRPQRYLAPEAEYLEAARVLRPDVNMARAGVAARRSWAAYNQAKLFPDIGLGLGADFETTPSAVQQNNAYVYDPWNHFFYYFGVGLRWSLDLLPQAARIDEAQSQLEETRSLERLALGNAMYEVEKAYADVVEASGREEAWGRAEHLARQWISTVQDQIDVGSNDERALLEPLRVYGNARVQHLYSLLDYNVSLSNLALVSGWDNAAPEK